MEQMLIARGAIPTAGEVVAAGRGLVVAAGRAGVAAVTAPLFVGAYLLMSLYGLFTLFVTGSRRPVVA